MFSENREGKIRKIFPLYLNSLQLAFIRAISDK
ncbi:hypothetical protein T03_17412 [Trichinella britovi]|uniref:Uncharacterized protein n=1 Tax=Trichinella britovi TaxID=45882 RepID=A0A0V0Z480_TRIBR|nr:hypothetical protein T03_17412 [Trichinella britovi]